MRAYDIDVKVHAVLHRTVTLRLRQMARYHPLVTLAFGELNSTAVLGKQSSTLFP